MLHLVISEIKKRYINWCYRILRNSWESIPLIKTKFKCNHIFPKMEDINLKFWPNGFLTLFGGKLYCILQVLQIIPNINLTKNAK